MTGQQPARHKWWIGAANWLVRAARVSPSARSGARERPCFRHAIASGPGRPPGPFWSDPPASCLRRASASSISSSSTEREAGDRCAEELRNCLCSPPSCAVVCLGARDTLAAAGSQSRRRGSCNRQRRTTPCFARLSSAVAACGIPDCIGAGRPVGPRPPSLSTPMKHLKPGCAVLLDRRRGSGEPSPSITGPHRVSVFGGGPRQANAGFRISQLRFTPSSTEASSSSNG